MAKPADKKEKTLMTANDVRDIINSVLVENGEMPISDFSFGEFKDYPDKRGVFQIKSQWFVYRTDEKNVKSISGPFCDSDIIFACAMMLHKSKYFEKYRFGSEAKEIYVSTHYRSVNDVEELTL